MIPPNNPPEPSPASFDAVATQRAIREQISQETAGMTFEQLQRYLREHIAVPFSATPTGRPIAA